MVFKNIISSILKTFLGPNKGPPRVCRNAEVSANEQSKCAVCLSSLKGEMGTRVLPCRHEFHVACVDRWLAVPCFNSTCPVCRLSINDDRRCGYDDDNYDDHEMRRSECFLTEEMIIWFSSFHVAAF
ncbi:hypothetical protein CASFOL_001128 [Castilleja foliolosa]|uniref:RING-type E3 ubiquitin transferase n=1 Tax=Castilleja foliolosa TaxID=1961234 RepID=A0ABD3ENL6_9LAMI